LKDYLKINLLKSKHLNSDKVIRIWLKITQEGCSVLGVLSSPIKTKVNNVFIHVINLKESAEWYSNLLGIPFDPDKVESPVYNIPVTSETGLSLDDHTFDPGFNLNPSDHVLFNFLVDDVEEAYTFVKSKGITITREIERIGDFAYFNFRDPDGNVLMICNC
jgi:predicted enzyme related to lactoylglutathione lyase